MSSYISSFIIEPVVRQARRISRLSTDSDPPHTPAGSLRDWNPGRFWNASPSPSVGEDELDAPEPRRVIRGMIHWPWDGRTGTASMPSPPQDPIDLPENEAEFIEASVPSREVETLQSVPSSRRTTNRTASDQSINPSYGVSERLRPSGDVTQGPSSLGTEVMAQQEDTMAHQESTLSSAPASQAEEHNRRRGRSGSLPTDDGMGPMRQRIHAIWKGEGSSSEKSRLIHILMTERYNSSQASLQNQQIGRAQSPASFLSQDRPLTPASGSSIQQRDAIHDVPMSAGPAAPGNPFNITSEDLIPTYAPEKPREQAASNTADAAETDLEELPDAEAQLGCVHYKRNVKLQCSACKRWYTCRFCHDAVEDHFLNRRETKNMLCMVCSTPQPAAEWCRNCGERAAWYYCSVCKLWDNDTQKSIYHCDDCGICRVGEGLGRDFFHCKTCAVCMSINVEKSHKCIERSTKCDCPICGEYMFTSPQPVVFMKCGHSIHSFCFKEYCKVSYKCPICTKSITNMETQFRALDRVIASQPMPEEYAETRAWVFCADCNAKSSVMYHWLGLKCEVCESYNTTRLELMNGAGPVSPQLEDLPTDDHDLGNAILTADISQPEEAPPTGATSSPRLIPHATSTHRSSFAGDSTVRPSTSPPYLFPHRTGARSVSPVVGSYFALSRQENNVRDSGNKDDNEAEPNEVDVDFWGRPFETTDEAVEDDSESDEDEDMSDEEEEDEVMEDDGLDDDDDEDHLDIFGHR